ncbi:2-hydroxy-3-oxopropionate reductase [Mycobacterium kansasii]
MTIGFIGLGIMGNPMAANLIKAGREIAAHSRSGVPSTILELGAQACKSPGAATACAEEIVILMLPDTEDVELVLFGPHGVVTGDVKGKIIVDMSSISPLKTAEFAERLEALGASYVDAPVSGGEIAAQNATLTIMAGGGEDVYTRVEPLLQQLGANVSRVGAIGSGQTAKIANQIIVALTIEAVGEALLFAARAGADPGKVRQALMGGFASSRILEVHGERMIKGSFEPGFRITLHQKDLNNALSAARAMNLPLPATALTQQLFTAAAAHGKAAADHSALITALETLSGYQLDR